MENQSDLDETCRFNWQLLVELGGLRVKFDEKELVNPEMKEIEHASKGIQNGHTCREHEDAPEICVILSINVVTGNLVSCVQIVQFVLQV